eukprot:CAMPEP_0178511876 /NCGR_PEP_ID=MMETSP0696-20121128/22595_1 /TAXON_ID=265572 /ORGANISM="Extubocellulus spinifer, Strain CCMP396" /LENGTH=248 /DNA_ID=CAMNT_0020141677 /DNA_START=100 /DNA_END=846 /DNA_ORIENTATION=-
MKRTAAFFLAFLAIGAEAFVFNPSPQRRSYSYSKSAMPMVSQTPSNSRYISFSADTGFLVSPSAFYAVLDRFELRRRLAILLNEVDTTDIDNLAERGFQARHLIMNSGLPSDLEEDIKLAYAELCKDSCLADDEFPSVQVRAAPSDVWPDAAFAGHQASVLGVSGVEDVTESVLECFATIFSDEAIAYRADHGIDHLGVHGAVAVSRMDVVRNAWAPSADDTSSYDVRPDKGFRDVTILNHHTFRPRA